jgi:hypothetical protein
LFVREAVKGTVGEVIGGAVKGTVRKIVWGAVSGSDTGLAWSLRIAAILEDFLGFKQVQTLFSL